jgi:hypothetical protein
MKLGWFSVALCVLWSQAAGACELCAIYSASNAQGGAGRGVTLSLSEQFVMNNTYQFEGEEFDLNPILNQGYLNTYLTHIVPGYNFSSRFGVSLSVPYVYHDFHRVEFTTLGGLIDEKATESGFGDASLIGRWAPVYLNEMNYSVTLNLLAGVKFPTGNTERLDDEVGRAEVDQALFGDAHQHSSIASVHQHEISLGSGSYDGIFGTALTARWKRFFFKNQLQYYLRTEARGYRYGDLFIASGGPGAYVVLADSWTASVQGNVFYETSGRDELIGQLVPHSGITAWYAGPQINLTITEHFGFNAAVDIPLRIYNRGLQLVPDYRIHGGLIFSF